MNQLRAFGLCYLATPYSEFPLGRQAAFRDAARLAWRLIDVGVTVFSPIVHSHPIAVEGLLDPLDVERWLRFDKVFVDRSDALIVAEMPRWSDSAGIGQEINWFRQAGKPRFQICPRTLHVAEFTEAAADCVRTG